MSSKSSFSIRSHVQILLSCLTFTLQASPTSPSATSSTSSVAYRQRWRMPNGNLPDGTQSIVIGQSIEVSWKSLNDSINDLWLMASSDEMYDRAFAQYITGKFNQEAEGWHNIPFANPICGIITLLISFASFRKY